jgi:hypothetical protein
LRGRCPHKYAKLRHDFERVANADAFFGRVDADEGYQSCLKKGKARGLMVHLAKREPAATSIMLSPATGARRSLALTGPSDFIAGDPTYCQTAAMGLHDAAQIYWEARRAFYAATIISFFGGTAFDGSILTYDPLAPLSAWGAMTLELAAANLAWAESMAGIWGTFFNLGSCGSANATYGYGYDTTSGCVTDYATIETSYDGGLTWQTWWSGNVSSCVGSAPLMSP